jgi:hypothetical protein
MIFEDYSLSPVKAEVILILVMQNERASKKQKQKRAVFNVGHISDNHERILKVFRHPDSNWS